MFLDFISNHESVQVVLVAFVGLTVISAIALRRSKDSQIIDRADKADARDHELEIWTRKQGALEHTKTAA